MQLLGAALHRAEPLRSRMENALASSGGETRTRTPGSLSADELLKIDAWRRAANYLNVGQIYLQANPLLREKLVVDHLDSSATGVRRPASILSMFISTD
jgi:phosphoketolase